MSTIKVNKIENTSTADGGITIDSAGRVGLGVTPSNFGSGRNALELHSSGATLSYLALTNTTTGSDGTNNGFNIIQNGNEARLFNRENADMAFYTNSSERCRILAAGGLTFGGETDAAHALDDYEEGTHVPVLTANSGTLGTVGYHGDRGARYVRIGTMVWYWGTMRFTSFSAGTGSGTLNISLPVAAAARVTGDDGDNVGPVSTQVWNGTAAVRPTVMKIRHNTSTAFFQRHGYDVDNSNCDVSDYNSTFMAAFSICYRAA